MAQATSAQREPSMEEILASIRRIIEDGDGGKRPSDEVADTETDAEMPVKRAEPTIVDVDAFRAELGSEDAVAAVPIVETATPPPLPTRPVSLADIQAEVRRSSSPEERDFASRFTELGRAPAFADAAKSRPEPVGEADADLALQPTEPPAMAARSEPVVARAPIEPRSPQAADEDASAQPGDAHWRPVAPGRIEPPAPAEPAASTRPGSVMRASILSEHAQKQVSASFGELWEAFSASRQRSFDEMAEQMMRPMLQDWLDNNLPTLVERLVREEIERIARGG
ncbi:MAG: DUF2497 domain-containing protein [Rhizobiaceae bacterium]